MMLKTVPARARNYSSVLVSQVPRAQRRPPHALPPHPPSPRAGDAQRGAVARSVAVVVVRVVLAVEADGERVHGNWLRLLLLLRGLQQVGVLLVVVVVALVAAARGRQRRRRRRQLRGRRSDRRDGVRLLLAWGKAQVGDGCCCCC
jgi:hypothetical protein